MILVVVESPGKIKKLQDYLGKNYKVTSSVGHIIDLPAKTLSVDINNNFEPTYKPLPGKSSVIKDLQTLAQKCTEVIIASDKDREGEMIGWSIAHVLKLKNPKRIVFGEITKEGITNAINNPSKLNQNMIDSQKARRVLDRIVGYYLSPLLWKSVMPGLSAGRVQSVSVRVIVDRENEIREFLKGNIPKHYKFTCEFTNSKNKYNSVMYKKTEKNVAKVEKETDAKRLMDNFTKSDFSVSDIINTTSTRNPGKPFTTSTLTQEAGKKLGFTVKRTMMAAQNLYEAGHITYMRTDSIVLSKEVINATEKYVLAKHGKEYHKKRVFSPPSKNSQEAHEAVRPTNVNNENIPAAKKIKADELKLYSLIWKRTVATQMSPAVFNVNTMCISASNEKTYEFRTTFNSLKFPGFLAVYNVTDLNENTEDEMKTGKLPKNGSKMSPENLLANTEFKNPPPRFDEPSFVKKLDPETGLNIGRPATYVQLVSRIQEKNYVEMRDNQGTSFKANRYLWKGKGKVIKEDFETILGADKNKLSPTPLGELVTEFLVKRFPEVMDYKFTSEMEEFLDKVSNGNMKWYTSIKTFYDKFVPLVEKVKGEKSLKETKQRVLGKINGDEVTVNFGKYGAYIQQGDSKVKRAPVKPPLNFDSVTLKDAIELLKYPIDLGKIGAKEVLLKKGKYGFYVTIGKKSIPVDNDKITLEEIQQKLKEEKKEEKGTVFTEDTKIYKVLNGPYGPFINVTDTKNKKIKYNASIPSDTDIASLDLEKIKQLINDYYENKKLRRLQKGKTKEESKQKTQEGSSKKSTNKKTTNKKTTNKKK